MSNLLSPLSGGATEPTDQFLLKLESHWTNDVGLRKSTRRRYLPTIRRFLGSQFGTVAIDWSLMTPEKIAGFVTTELAPGTATRKKARARPSACCCGS